MKRLKFFAPLIAFGVLFSACGSSGPENAEDLDLKSWIYRYCASSEVAESVDEKFFSALEKGTLGIEGIKAGDINMEAIESGLYPSSLEVACVDVFLANYKMCIVDGGLGCIWVSVFQDPQVALQLEYMSNLIDFSDGLSFLSGEGESGFDLDDRTMFVTSQEAKDAFFEEEWPDIIGSDDSDSKDGNALIRQNPQKAKKLISELYDAYFDFIAEIAEERVRVLNWDYNAKSDGDSYTGYLVEYEIGDGYYVLLDLTEFGERYEWAVLYEGSSLSELHDCYE